MNPCVCDSALAPAFSLEGGSLAPVPSPTEPPGEARPPAAPSPTPCSGGEGLAGRQVAGCVHKLHGSGLLAVAASALKGATSGELTSLDHPTAWLSSQITQADPLLGAGHMMGALILI